MVGKYMNKSKHHTIGRENTRTKVSITLMVGQYRNESKYCTNGKKIQELK